MNSPKPLSGLVIAWVVATSVVLAAQSLPNEPWRGAGAGVTGAFEGWYQNPDGSYSLLFGYFSRNQRQSLDLAVGPDNHFEPGPADRGQPTHFLPGRQAGLFVVTVPPDFGNAKIRWTLVADGRSAVVPGSLSPDYRIDPFSEGNGNTPPTVAFDESSRPNVRTRGITIDRSTTVGKPLPLSIWISDDAKGAGGRRGSAAPVVVRWTKFRGVGPVVFEKESPAVERLSTPTNAAGFRGKSTTNVTFSEPGLYMLHVVVTDVGGGGSQCCFAFGDVKVNVTP